MDHHCPWFNSCVGHFNHRFFYLFMLYIWLGCIYVCGVAYSPFNARKTLRKVSVPSHIRGALGNRCTDASQLA
jgi:palmitoyltransferase